MLIWANKNDTNTELTNNMRKIYGKNSIKGFKPWELSIILRQIQRHFGKRKNISILDFGAGVSPFGAYLTHLGYQDVTCLDKKRGWHREINEKRYNEKYNASVKYVKTDITSNYDGEHDVIFSASVLEHIGENARVKIMQVLFKHLKPGGLIIHVVDYDKGVDFKGLINNCGMLISHKPEETPGCEEFKEAPSNAWFIDGESRVAFFNEK